MLIRKRKFRFFIPLRALDQKALVRSRNRKPSVPYPGRPGGWRRS